MGNPVVTLRDLVFAWPHHEPVLEIPELTLYEGERVFIKGPSGSGKSTLLSLLAGIHTAQQGTLEVLGQSLAELSASSRDRFRAANLGYLFQQFNLLPYLGLLDNVMLPCRFSAERAARATARSGSPRADAQRLLERLRLDPASWSRPPTTLSVGQQQRVAAARAFIGQPALLMADEPVSALDEAHQQAFMTLVQEECLTSGAALLLVSHDRRLAAGFGRQLVLAEGRLK